MADRIIRVTIGLFVLATCGARLVCAQSSDELFEADAVQEIRLFLNSTDVYRLETNYLDNRFYAADLQWRSVRVRNIGIRSRGSASRNGTKPGLQIEFDQYVNAQRFVGLRSLVLDNLWQDPSMVREKVAFKFFERMGLPSPRVSFARLFVNDVYYGLYGIVEAVTPDFLLRTVGEADGYVFEYKNVRPYHFEYLGDDLSAYKPLFEPRSRRSESDAVLYGPIRDLIREVNEPDDAVWRDRVEQRLDLAQFLSYVAVETFLAEADGFLGGNGMANFYLARPAGGGPHRLIAWDRDLAFSEIGFPLFLRAEENILFLRALAFPDLREHYLNVLESCARSAFSRGWLWGEVVRTASLISAAVSEDGRKPNTTEEFTAAIEYLRRFAIFRPQFVLREVDRARRSGS